VGRRGRGEEGKDSVRPRPFRAAVIGLAALLVAATLIAPHPATAADKGGSRQAISVFVSIIPQAYFVKRVGGDLVDVSVLVGPGQGAPYL
jgi:ABC-type metal ion transport system, periplasmic component/surface adhesin